MEFKDIDPESGRGRGSPVPSLTGSEVAVWPCRRGRRSCSGAARVQERVIGLVNLVKFITISVEGVNDPADELFLLWNG